MLKIQFDVKRMKVLKDMVVRLRDGEIAESIQADYEEHFQEVDRIQRLLMIQELMSGEDDFTIEDVQRFSEAHYHLYGKESGIINPLEEYDSGHPARVLVEENRAFQEILKQIRKGLELIEEDPEAHPEEVTNIQEQTFRLGEFHKHYHRKEKLFFPIFERYGQYTPARLMWRLDDRIRALYQGAKRQIDQLPDVGIEDVLITFDRFEEEFIDMIYQEEELILPVFIAKFNDEDWQAIAEESDAFGYALIEVENEWNATTEAPSGTKIENDNLEALKNKDIPFGGGYLTIEEANLILNHLPLEITFVDKSNVFKYFNNITEASEMMLVRTPTSIGRAVSNCHPPKSLRKVMTLVRDLKAKRRTTESMWIKKQGKYVYITYKGIFNEADEFIGLLEYVQDIQPFFELPTEIKTGLSELED